MVDEKKSKKTNIDETEIILKEHIERRGLVMIIEHLQYKEPKNIKVPGIIRGNRVVAMTKVFLYNAEEWEDKKKRLGMPPLAAGYSLCSGKDQFARKIGRVTAGYRALRHYEKVHGV